MHFCDSSYLPHDPHILSDTSTFRGRASGTYTLPTSVTCSVWELREEVIFSLLHFKYPTNPSAHTHTHTHTIFSVSFMSHLFIWCRFSCANKQINKQIYSMGQNYSWKANIFSVSQDIPHVLCNRNFHYSLYKSPPIVAALSQITPVHICAISSLCIVYFMYNLLP